MNIKRVYMNYDDYIKEDKKKKKKKKEKVIEEEEVILKGDDFYEDYKGKVEEKEYIEQNLQKNNFSQIEQKHAWSKEDDYNVQCLIAKVTYDIQKGNVGRNYKLIDWLKSLKKRMNNV